MLNHADDTLSLFESMAEGDQVTKDKLLGDTETYLQSDAIALKASDHCFWRKSVVACSAAK